MFLQVNLNTEKHLFNSVKRLLKALVANAATDFEESLPRGLRRVMAQTSFLYSPRVHYHVH